jgi:hypothetical protein
VGDPVGLHPGISERLGLDDLADLGADKALDTAFQRPREPLQLVGHLRAKAAGGQRVHRLVGQALDVEVGEDLGGDLVGDGLLDGRVSGQGGHRADIAVGVGDLVAGPHRHPGQRRQHTPNHDQQNSHDRAPPLPPRRPGAGHARLVAGHAGALVHGVTLPGSGASASPAVGDSRNEPSETAAAMSRLATDSPVRVGPASSLVRRQQPVWVNGGCGCRCCTPTWLATPIPAGPLAP